MPLQLPAAQTESVMALVNSYTRILFAHASQFDITRIPAAGTVLSSTAWDGILDRQGRVDAQAYKFMWMGPHGQDGVHAFYFGSVISSPTTPVLTFYDTDDSYPWPKVLKHIYFDHVEIDGASISIGSDATEKSRWAIRKQLTGRYDGLTQVKIEVFISDVLFPKAVLATRSLQPSVVEWELVNDQGHIEALHGSVVTPRVVITGSSTVIAHQRTFDATPDTDWVDHVFHDKVSPPWENRTAYWIRIRKTAYAPANQPGETDV